MWETCFNSCEVMLLQENYGPFQASGCFNRCLALYITQAVTDHNKHERKPRVRGHGKAPAAVDRQTDRQEQLDTACCTYAQHWMGLPPFSTSLKFLRPHLEIVKVKPSMNKMGFTSTNFM